MNYHWNWGIFFDQVQNGDETYLAWLISALGWTVAVSITAWIMALVLGAIIGTLRTVPHRGISFFANAWVELFRNIPLLVQMFLWFFVVPELLPKDLALWVKQDMPAKEFVTAAICLGLFTSMGFTRAQVYRYVLLPMAFRIIVPPLTSELMNIFKNSSVAFAIGVLELTFVSRQMQEDTSQGIEVYAAVTLLYFICAFAANRGMALVEKRVQVPGYIAGAH